MWYVCSCVHYRQFFYFGQCYNKKDDIDLHKRISHLTCFIFVIQFTDSGQSYKIADEIEDTKIV